MTTTLAVEVAPVWNGLTDSWHPTQMLADVLTMVGHRPSPPERITCCFLGDGRNNVARSLLITGAMLGMDVRIAAPCELGPPADVVATTHDLAASSGARALVADDPIAGVACADFVYTDVWVSMGESSRTWTERVPRLLPYRVTEATDEVFTSPRSIVFDQAENRLHTIKAVLVDALGGRGSGR